MSIAVDRNRLDARLQEGRRSPVRIGPEAIRAYDIRGLAGREIDADGSFQLGLSFASAARARGLRCIAVGRDGRQSSPALERALVDGLVSGGMWVEAIGVGPTPMLAFAAQHRGLDGWIMVTASHNPAGENGFKLSLGDQRVHGVALRRLAARQGDHAPGGSLVSARVLHAYVDALASAAEGMAPLRIAWDCGNGASGPVAERLAPRLPGACRLLNTRVDGRFPSHHPDPAVAANLAELARVVVQEGCDLGAAFDGDGDRLGVVDQEGQVVWPDQLLLLLAQQELRDHPGAAVVGDVKCSRILFDGIEALGGSAVMSPSGYVNVYETMQASGAVIGGELSGHIFFAEGWHGVDDAIYAAIRTFRAVSRSRGGLAGFRRRLPPTFLTPELRIPCPENRMDAVVEEVARRIGGRDPDFDPCLGLRVETRGGWWLLRASGTESVLSCRCEADTPEALEGQLAMLERQLMLSGVDPGALHTQSSSSRTKRA
jgi:phosphomannomutase